MNEFYDIAKGGISDTKQRHEHFESIEKQKYELHDEIVCAITNIEKSVRNNTETINKNDRDNAIIQKCLALLSAIAILLALYSIYKK